MFSVSDIATSSLKMFSQKKGGTYVDMISARVRI